MSTVTENDLRELKDLINDRFNELRLNQEKIMTRLEDWKPSIDKVSDLSEKVGEYKNWKQISIILLTGFLTSLFWMLRNNPNI